MKNLTNTAIFFLIISSLFYILFSMYSININIASWSEQKRFIYTFVEGFILVFSIIHYYTNGFKE